MYDANSHSCSPDTLSTDAAYLSQVLRGSALEERGQAKCPLGCTISLLASRDVVL
jgi:hypothetical protein